MNFLYVSILTLLFTVFITVIFGKNRFLILIFPLLILFPGLPFLLKTWIFMFENTKYSLINRILAFMSFPELLTGIDEKTVLSLFFIWIIPPLNACYILFFSGKAAIEMEYLYNECGISLFKKLIFKFTPDYFFRLSCLAAADILFYIILTFGSLNSN